MSETLHPSKLSLKRADATAEEDAAVSNGGPLNLRIGVEGKNTLNPLKPLNSLINPLKRTNFINWR